MFPFYLPWLMLLLLFTPYDKNFITKAKEAKPLSGKLNVASSGNIDFRVIKKFSKTIGMTINDIVMSALSKAFH